MKFDKKYMAVILFIFACVIITFFAFQSSSSSVKITNRFVSFAFRINNWLNDRNSNWKAEYILVRKFAHTIEYLLLGITASFLFKKRYLAGPFFTCMAVSIADQLSKILIPGREFDITDLPFDFMGYTIGILLIYLFRNESMRREMHKPHNLFIMGNGFDLAHRMHTSYDYFEKYLRKHFQIDPDVEDFTVPVPSSTVLPDGREEYDMNSVASYIIEQLDIATSKDKWGDLESCIGGDLYYFIGEDELRNPDFDQKDNDIYNDVAVNEQIVEDINYIFTEMKRLFIRWVKEDLPHALDGIEKKLNEKNVLDKGGLYLSFNYTKTLEELYGVKDVLHIHGTVDSNEDQIMFGHHDKRPVSENMGTYYGIDELDTLKKGLYKDTESLIQNNQAFFKELDYITDIYSYGFSFSEPDEAYLDEIQKHLKPENVRWHITQYDIDNNPEYENMLKKRGYQIGDVVW